MSREEDVKYADARRASSPLLTRSDYEKVEIVRLLKADDDPLPA